MSTKEAITAVHAPHVGTTNSAKTFLAPWEPPTDKWDGLARDIVMWLQTANGTPWKGSDLYKHLRNLGRRIPNWLKREIADSDSCPPKGAVVAAIYKAMLVGDEEHPSDPGYEEA